MKEIPNEIIPYLLLSISLLIGDFGRMGTFLTRLMTEMPRTRLTPEPRKKITVNHDADSGYSALYLYCDTQTMMQRGG